MVDTPDYSFFLDSTNSDEREALRTAGQRILECYRVLEKGGLNIVGEILKGQGTFYEMNHYPDGDVFDAEYHSQYYYHAHRDGVDEHGHFHTFVRAGGFARDVRPMDALEISDPWPRGDEALMHLVAISMDAWGYPRELFTTNRWVTDETWYPAEDVSRTLNAFEIDHAYPSWPVNIWITNMLRLFRPQIHFLLHERDQVIAAHRAANPKHDVLEDREIEITSRMAIDVPEWVEVLKRSG